MILSQITTDKTPNVTRSDQIQVTTTRGPQGQTHSGHHNTRLSRSDPLWSPQHKAFKIRPTRSPQHKALKVRPTQVTTTQGPQGQTHSGQHNTRPSKSDPLRSPQHKALKVRPSQVTTTQGPQGQTHLGHHNTRPLRSDPVRSPQHKALKVRPT